MEKSLAGKVALITGGSRGLGAATALALADEGADIAISFVASEEKAAKVVREVEAKGVRAKAFRADQGEPKQSAPLVQAVVAHFGKLDILVNNAAIALQGHRIDDPAIDNEAMDRQWAINVAGVVANIRAAAKVLPDGGRIISVGSGLGTRALWPGAADYSATKAAVLGYTRGAARDLGPRNITVNVVQAGIMDTDMAAGAAHNLPVAVLDMHPIRRIATVEEVAGAIVYLAGPKAGYITGSVLDVNGGVLA